MGRRALAPQLTWPLLKSDLQAALAEGYAEVEIKWTDWDKQGGQDPLSVSWQAESPELPGWPARGAPVIWVRPVSRVAGERARTLLLRDALPDLACWLDRARNAPDTWRDTRHERRWVLTDDGVDVLDDDGLHILDRERGRG